MRNETTIIKNGDIDDTIIPVSFLIKIIWQYRLAFIAIILLTVISALGLRAIFSEYKSEGFFQFGGAIPVQQKLQDKDKDPNPGITLANYKRYAAAFKSSERFVEFLKQCKLENSPGVDVLRHTFSSREGISKWIEPVYPFTKLDAKELLEEPKEGGNNVIGLRISYEDKDAKNAQNMVGLLGRYTMDTIIYMIYSDELRFKHNEMTARITRLDNEIIENKEHLAQYRRAGEDLKKIVSRYHDSANQVTRQVVTITDDNARYLPPTTQLMTTEVQASAAEEKIYQAKRDQQQSILLREYYDKAKSLADGSKSGEEILRGLDQIKVDVFKNKNLEDETIKQIYNKITIDNQLAITQYLEKSRFIAGPSLPDYPTLRLGVTVLFSLFGGILLAICFIFFHYSLRKNQSEQ